MKKKYAFFVICFFMILIYCTAYAKYILTEDFNFKCTSVPFIFDASIEKDIFVMDTVGVNINFSVKNFDENQNYNDYDVEYHKYL